MPILLGKSKRGEDVYAVDLCNSNGDSARILSLGGILQTLNITTPEHGVINTVLGYSDWSKYLTDTVWMGATAGRYCNRIANARFSIGAAEYLLERNQGDHHLHGGPEGFHRKVWNIEHWNKNSLILSLLSKDGDQGYPGNLEVTLRYSLEDDSTLKILWRATSDLDTVVSITNHSYFNLAGTADIRNHDLKLSASHFTPMDASQLPTGEILPVKNTCLDFRKPRSLSMVLDSADPMITNCGGLDHNWALEVSSVLQPSAQLYCPDTQLLLELSSTLPGIQCYTGNYLADHGLHDSHAGIALEPQYYPNSPNQSNFPSPVLRAGDTREHEIHYHFCAEPAGKAL